MGSRVLHALVQLVFVPAVLFSLGASARSVEPDALDSEETRREQEAARESGPAAAAFSQPPSAPAGPLSVAYPLFAGLSNAGIPAYRIDPATADTIEAFTGGQVWGAAYDEVLEVVYFNTGSSLYEWPVGGAVNLLGPVVNSEGTEQSLVSLACFDGVLYGTKNTANEAVYRIDPGTLVATVHIDYPDAEFDFGGLAADPRTGDLYGLSDDTSLPGVGLYRINQNGTATLITAYPEGQTDLDGLAISPDGIAWLIPDEPGSIYVYDLDADAYLPPLSNPWTTSEIFSGGTWIWTPPQLLVKGKLSCAFAKPAGDGLKISGSIPPDANLPVLTDGLAGTFTIGGFQRGFAMTAKGKSARDASLKVALKLKNRSFSISLKKVDLAAALSIPDEDMPMPGERRLWRWSLRLENGFFIGGAAPFTWTATAGKGGRGAFEP